MKAIRLGYGGKEINCSTQSVRSLSGTIGGKIKCNFNVGRIKCVDKDNVFCACSRGLSKYCVLFLASEREGRERTEREGKTSPN